MNGLDHKMPYTTYALRTENGDSYPQEIIIKFIVKQSLYEYMLKFQDNKILEEYLYFYPISKTASGRKNTLFKRIYQHPKYILEKLIAMIKVENKEINVIFRGLFLTVFKTK